MSVRGLVKGIQTQLRDTSMTPELARTALVQLTALLGSIGDEVRISDVDYKKVLLKALQSGGAANRARIEAECSPEFLRYREAKDVQEQAKQMVVTCRAYLRSLDEEMRLQR